MTILHRVQGWGLWKWPQQKGKAPKSPLLLINEGNHTNSASGVRLGPGSYRPVRGCPAYYSPPVEFEVEALEGGAGDGSTRGAESPGRSIDSAGRTQHAKYERSLIRPRVDSPTNTVMPYSAGRLMVQSCVQWRCGFTGRCQPRWTTGSGTR